jgi:hypothetical protein
VKNQIPTIIPQPKSHVERKLGEVDISNSKGFSDQKNTTHPAKYRKLVVDGSWASSSGRIEHQPPKLGVVGSNPTPPATLEFRFVATIFMLAQWAGAEPFLPAKLVKYE